MHRIRSASLAWLATVVFVGAFGVLIGVARAHNVWLESEPDSAYLVQFGGHAG